MGCATPASERLRGTSKPTPPAPSLQARRGSRALRTSRQRGGNARDVRHPFPARREGDGGWVVRRPPQSACAVRQNPPPRPPPCKQGGGVARSVRLDNVVATLVKHDTPSLLAGKGTGDGLCDARLR